MNTHGCVVEYRKIVVETDVIIEYVYIRTLLTIIFHDPSPPLFRVSALGYIYVYVLFI